jgi:acetyl esterase/lipase
MRPTLLCLALILIPFLAVPGRAAEMPLVLDLWLGKAPGAAEKVGEEKLTGNKGSRQLTNVSRPTITVFRPEKTKETGVAVLIAPGGGYNFLAWDHEGEDVASWLNALGITGILLKYRVPMPPGPARDNPSFAPHQDAQRAMRLARSKAKEWGIDPNRIGMLGFSAGGHLTAMTATSFDTRAYEPIDDTDQMSYRPDFAVLLYPGGVVRRGSDALVPGVHVSKETPPAFFAHCSDDRVSAENSVMMYVALKRAGVPAELHIYASGGHGFGLRPSKHPSSQWPKRCEEWLRDRGILAAEAGNHRGKVQ